MHLLAVETGSLDEIDAAVDLNQTPADVVVLSFSDSDLSSMAAVWSETPALFPTLRLASLKRLRHPMSVDLYIERVIAGARLVIVRGLGGLDYWRYGFERIADFARRHGIMFVALPGDDRRDPRLDALATVSRDALGTFESYFRAGGPANTRNALLHAAKLLGADVALDPPVELSAVLALDANGDAVPLESVEAGTGPVALITFYRASLLAGDYSPIITLAEQLKQRGFDAVPVAVTSLKDPDVTNVLARFIDRVRPDIILNATSFSALRADETTVLDGADCMVLQVALAGHSRPAWEAASRGLSPTDLAMNVVLPELDGRVFTRAISFKADLPAEAGLEYARVVHEPDAGRIAFVADLAAAWGRLRRTPRADRRVVVMLSDYPNRAGRTGYACGLDTPESVVEVLSLLGASGYTVGCDAIARGDDLIAQLAGQLPSETLEIPLTWYASHLAEMPQQFRDALGDAWGAPEDDPCARNGSFRVSCVRCGNVLIALQPDRGANGDRKAGYHDLALPPRHAYVALYAWLTQCERIDALVHMGTHGTLEWLPGKALALSESCCPEAVLGPVPVIYPFIVNNPGEAVQAKRRISAVTIGHLTPPLCEAGLAGPLGELEGLIEEYAEADGVDRRRIAILEREILDRAWRSGLAKDCRLSENDAPRDAIAKLDAQLCDIKDLAIRDHLHVFGRTPDAEPSAALAAAIVRAAPSVSAAQTADLIAACAQYERDGLLAALDGRRVAAGPAGAPTRGRCDVLPTGRNLTTIDPRGVPTRTAAIVGWCAADEVVRRYLQDHGDHPRALMLDLWASASLRTGGDDLAQALAFLGARPKWDDASNRLVGIEVLPLAKLDRPRIDVTLRISGSFRDIFPAQIALFNLAVRMVAERDEPDEWNALAAVRRGGGSLARIFGGEPGTYGAGAASAVLDGPWATRDELAEAYLEASSHAYGPEGVDRSAPHEFAERVATTDALIHPQDDRERDLLDGDGVADFAGGFSAAAQRFGRSPSLYHLDTSVPDAPRARTIEEEIVRIVRGRLTNPRWLAGIATHGHRGVAEIAQGVDALYAFAATAGVVRDHLFDAVHDAIIADEDRVSMLLDRNASATQAIAARLKDLIDRRLWTPRRNAVHAELAAVLRGERVLVRALP